MSWEPSASQIVAFHEQGYLVIESLIEPSRVALLRAAFDELLDRWSAECSVSRERYLQVISQWTNVWEKHPQFATQVHHPRMLAIVRGLLGVPALRLFHDHLIFKPGRAEELRSATIPWHQDFPFWPVDAPRAVSCWLALDDVSADSGAMRFMPGAHLEGEEPPVDFLCRQKDWGARAADAVPIEVPAGGAVFHSCLSWHMSPPNHSVRDRRAYITIMLDAACRWQPAHADWHPMNKRVTVEPGQPFNEDVFPILGRDDSPAVSP